ncbi:N-acetylglucosaminyldiphosphoundecaprenol N-acetyl-beta-D-mannosaminyltransferase [Thermocatellispora tengchongensis]|uniref:N-acetylglucosaminyldiphosphoundecaprenol N-acetyl-beta-D-mannosaminyltransferase n=1 Tax=Thermocatellispora tengchongensis TaxID=1073253 RepID=A0A840PLX9_9ACTN|nr:WecB/TagA/CpsF family glycosyltransferase [Thermocatellispora tengchongensis]MBB5139916.1 N-acetylglucosaminyldiphosphoundecaprenol N-acetyl-beta-D-mannosaminyltransferase [Thermocatellispora tengchongensis]
MAPERAALLGTVLDPLGMREVVARCVAAVDAGEYLSIGVVNAAKIVHMRADAMLRESVLDCDLVLADGQAVVWASRVLGRPVPERVAGIDLFLELLAEAARRGHRVYFLGARPHVLERVVAEARRRFPGLVVAGARDGYFPVEESETVAKEIAATDPDLLFLGITSPKKEIFVGEWGRATGAKVVHGVGGSFDILAGEIRRAPRVWQRAGLEWLYRLLQEPVRLGPRYLTTNTRFVLLLAAERLRKSRT